MKRLALLSALLVTVSMSAQTREADMEFLKVKIEEIYVPAKRRTSGRSG